MKLNKKMVHILMVIVMIVLSVGGCAADKTNNVSSTEEQSVDGSKLSGKLTIWAWGAGAEAIAREEAIEIFIADHPELEVEYSIIPTADSVWDQKASAALATGGAPDVIQMSPDYFGMNTEYYMDLNAYVEADGVNLDEVLVDGMLSGYYDTDGKLEGFPLLANCFVMAYNKDMFDEAGVAYPEDGWTLGELMDWGSGFVGGSGVNQTYAIVKHWVMDMVMAYAGGGTPYSEDLSTSYMDSPEILESLKIYQNLVGNGYMPSDAAQQSMSAQTLFISGKAAMYPMGGFESQSVIADAEENGINLGFCMMPSGTSDGKEINIQYATGWAITKTSQNPEAAWQFLKESAYANEGMNKETCASGMTSNKAVAQNYFAEMVYGDCQFNNSVYVEHMGATHINPWGGTLSSAGDYWSTMIEAVTLDSQEPSEVQATYAPQIATEFELFPFNTK